MGLFKSYSEKEVKRVQPLVKKINELEPDIQKLSDKELKGKTEEFKYTGSVATNDFPSPFFISAILPIRRIIPPINSTSK